MYEKFLALSPEKQNRIRDAALTEFARHGYQKTSVEQIAKAAEIAKGMVFHYFGTKKGLYEYLSHYTREVILDQYGSIDPEIFTQDYIQRYHHLANLKIQGMAEFPAAYDFLVMLYYPAENRLVSPQVEADYEIILVLQQEVMDRLMDLSDTDYFRDDIDKDQTAKYIRWLIDGYSAEIIQAFKGLVLSEHDIDRYWQEYYVFLDDLKKLFYKEDERN